MEASYRASQYKLTHINKSVHPKFHFCSSVMLLCFISHISRCSLSASNTIIALRSLSNNLSCFGTSTLCEYVLDSGKQLPSFFFLLLDHIGIILNILVTSVSVLLLENTGSRTSTSIILGVTLAGMVCATYLITWPREKGERVLEIGVCGALALCSVSLYNAVFAKRFYSRGSIHVLMQGSPEPYIVSGNSLMHLRSLIASKSHASLLVSSACI
ncbi:unnamed protein product [Penicillium salamii]|nr:unnamed protein product [Penicillium salamii]